MKTNMTETVYGMEMPVWNYSLTYACGCRVENIRIASCTPIADTVDFPHKCRKCDPTPPCNVWD